MSDNILAHNRGGYNCASGGGVWQDQENLHREDAKDAKKRKEEKEGRKIGSLVQP
jgi:hypothetical protein